MSEEAARQTEAEIRRAVAGQVGQAAWGVRKGFGSFVTLEFGAPNLHEPGPNPPDGSPKPQIWRSTRRATPRGEWHLWIYCCHWRLRQDDRLLCHSESADHAIQSALAGLDGQRLIEVTVEAVLNCITFSFDLGGKLETRPYKADMTSASEVPVTYEQWLLYAPDGRVFQYTDADNFGWQNASDA